MIFHVCKHFELNIGIQVASSAINFSNVLVQTGKKSNFVNACAQSRTVKKGGRRKKMNILTVKSGEIVSIIPLTSLIMNIDFWRTPPPCAFTGTVLQFCFWWNPHFFTHLCMLVSVVCIGFEPYARCSMYTTCTKLGI